MIIERPLVKITSSNINRAIMAGLSSGLWLDGLQKVEPAFRRLSMAKMQVLSASSEGLVHPHASQRRWRGAWLSLRCCLLIWTWARVIERIIRHLWGSLIQV